MQPIDKKKKKRRKLTIPEVGLSDVGFIKLVRVQSKYLPTGIAVCVVLFSED